ncbi:MAG: hypothetical protein FJ254_05105 [Phycisphaerae bacterium]|nr:hypothetical protein [Phycisphaerae bacterium]
MPVPAILAALLLGQVAPCPAQPIPSPIVRDGVELAPALAPAASVVRLDAVAWAGARANDLQRWQGVPIAPGRAVDLTLTRVQPFMDDAILVVAQGEKTEAALDAPAVDCFMGSVDGEPGSRAYIAISAFGHYGYVLAQGRTFILSSGAFGSNVPTLFYDLGALPPGLVPTPKFTCGALPVPGVESPIATPPDGSLAGAPCRQVRMAVETDHEYLQSLFGGSTSAATAYTAVLMGAVNEIYVTSLNTRIGVNYLRLWSTPDDPWSATSTGSQLGAFRDHWAANMSAQPRELAHFLSGRGLGGGVAWLSVVCNQSYGFGLSADLAGSFPYPIVHNSHSNWDLMVVAHEIGHNFGSPHTHDYSPAVDGCGSNPQDCAVADQGLGTIMSYCHICPGGLSNVRMELHPTCIASMHAHLDGNGCVEEGSSLPPQTMIDAITALPSQAVTIDPLVNDIPVNCEAIALRFFAPTTALGGVVERVGTTGSVLRYTAPASATGNDVIPYAIEETSGAIAWGEIRVQVKPLRAATPVQGDVASLLVDYYDLSAAPPSVLPDFAQLTPYRTFFSNQVNYPSTGGNFADSQRADTVGAVWTGWINVPASAEWTLFIESDDGSRLWIGDQLLMDNDGLHAMVERSNTIALAAGKHPVRLAFFENGGGAGMILRWQGPGVAKAVIPASALTRGGTVNWSDINLDGRVDGADLGILLSAWGTANAAADLNQSGVVDGADLGVLLSAWTG